MAGTPGYMAPELIVKKVMKDSVTQYTQSVDIWSLCVTFFGLISKKVPKLEEFLPASKCEPGAKFPDL